jgi:outer membrane phospholipase A
MYRAYVQPTLTLGQPGGLQFSLAPRAWFYAIDFSRNNPDMPAYKGYASLQSTLTWKQKTKEPSQAYKFTTAFGLGDNGSNASWKFDLSFSVVQWVKFFTPRIHVQYFTGYGQTMRQYNQYSHGLRAGISLYD